MNENSHLTRLYTYGLYISQLIHLREYVLILVVSTREKVLTVLGCKIAKIMAIDIINFVEHFLNNIAGIQS